MAEQVIPKSKFLKTIRELHPEVQGQDDESVTQKFLDYYPMLRRRVIDDATGTPAYRGNGKADTLQWKGSKEQDGNYEGTYSWKQNQPAPAAPPAPDRVTAAKAALEQSRPQTPVAAAPQSITVGSGPQARVEPIQSAMPQYGAPQNLTVDAGQQNRVEPIQSAPPAWGYSNDRFEIPTQQASEEPNPPVPEVPQKATVTAQQNRVEPIQMQNPSTFSIPPVSEPPKYDFTPDTMANLQKLGVHSGGSIPPPEEMPTVRPPSTADPYKFQADEYSQRADTLEQQAATPYPTAKTGKDRLIEAARAAMESFGKFGAPGGYEGQERLRRQDFAAQQNNTYARAKDLRASAQQQQALGETVRGREANQRIAEGNLEETKRLRMIQEQDAETKRQQANRPVVSSIAAGTTQTVRDPVTGKLIEKIDGNPPKDSNVGSYTNKEGRHMEIFQKADGSLYEKEFGEVRPPAMEGREQGSYQLVVGPDGNILGAWNPKADKTLPVPPELGGARKTPVPSTVNSKVADLENSHRKIIELGEAYRPEFVGPYAGRYEASKASGVLSFLPFLTTPEGYPQFAALNADLKNSIIKLITGAQMGQQEAQRILAQVPTERDKPEMWAGKYDQTRKNADFLLAEIRRLNGVDGGAAPAAPSGDGFVKPGGALEGLLGR